MAPHGAAHEAAGVGRGGAAQATGLPHPLRRLLLLLPADEAAGRLLRADLAFDVVSGR